MGAAVREDPRALEFVNKELQDDPRLLQAMSPSVLQAVCPTLEGEFQQDLVQEGQPLLGRSDELVENADLIPTHVAPSAAEPEMLQASMREDAPSLSHSEIEANTAPTDGKVCTESLLILCQVPSVSASPLASVWFAPLRAWPGYSGWRSRH